MAGFAPFDPPLGPQPPNPRLYHPAPVTLVMKEKVFSLSGDDFKVTTTDGAEVCRVKGKVISARDKKKFTLPDSDEELFTLSNKLLALHKSFHGESPQGHNFEVKGHFKLIGSKSSCHFRNNVGGAEVELEIKGDWIDRKAEISYQGRPVAAIQRKMINARELFGQQTYYVTVAPNVDLSMVAALCVSLDEKENEKK